MAAAKLPFQIALEQNTNDDSTAFGKWFGRTYSTSDTLSLRGLIERVAFDHVKGIHIRFIPENTKGEQLTSRKFRDQCTLQLAGVWTKRNITVGNKKKVVREFFTMADYKLNEEHPANNNQGG